MPEPLDQATRDVLTQAYVQYLQAMIDADTDALDRMLDDGYTLHHITGEVQPKRDWLAQVKAGDPDYHEIEQKETTVEVEDDTPRVTGKVVVDVTLQGERGKYNLILANDYAHKGDSWIALRTLGGTW
jgi:inosine-uridine nucleoside N-ribohydrolase